MNTKLKLAVLVAIVLIAITTVSQAQRFGDGIRGRIPDILDRPRPQYAIYLKIDGIEGESKDNTHKDWIDVLAYKWGGEEKTDSSTARDTGVRIPDDFVIAKMVDKATPALAEAVASGDVFFDVFVDVVGDDGSIIRYTLNETRVGSYRVEGKPRTGEDRPTEEVAFYYNKISFEYTEYNQRGRAIDTFEGMWDLEAGI